MNRPRRSTPRPGRRRDDTGSAAAELVIVTPMLLAFCAVVLLAGRLVLASQQLDDAARTAVASAQVQATAPAAAQAAQVAATNEVSTDRLGCDPYVVATNTAWFRAGGLVAVQVTCGVELPSIGVPGLPRTVTVASSALAPIETYREVG